jgi:SAM-dependent methyltransferase
MDTQFDSGNWIRKKSLLILGACTLGVGALIVIPLGLPYRLAMGILFVILLVSFLFPLYAYVMFAQKGGRFQEKVYHLIIQSLGAKVKGRILEIGSGNGVLAVKLAQQHCQAEVVGIDSWGKNWEYSKGVCEKNARSAKVQSRVHFQKGDAAALEFSTESMDGAISNLTFHEVQPAADKRALVREALRVVKPGGVFAFVDYFYDEKYYGKAAEFESYLRDLQLARFEYQPLQQMISIPLLLRHPKILGRAGIIRGTK